MQLVVLADKKLGEELLFERTVNENIIWIQNAEEFSRHENADGFIDLLFDGSIERIYLLKNFLPKPVIINSVSLTLKEIGLPVVRVNGWPGFLKRSLAEMSCANEEMRKKAENIFHHFGRKISWVGDQPGFITARVVSMIINEAWFALGENLSSPEEIDLAMKLGTNYPYGPFEWCNKIGVNNVFELLHRLSKTDSRYQPAPLLEKQIMV